MMLEANVYPDPGQEKKAARKYPVGFFLLPALCTGKTAPPRRFVEMQVSALCRK
ncbi:hypothetical protein Ethha_1417 [Ethanoligenens harbinense YUAN-3]|uniref:Uncharacterized protein n=1 Tax=Ethanoligenens harbinense (strain DSM 18485 / JCM 12961 / CGMCC 1.5033 / YUAN-3) TaxID=663278 RepID=E6U6Y7_ETHHY|nr:hypothetical protein Ethha_1417 [Ethanoligenens harbinense YUAN-3]